MAEYGYDKKRTDEMVEAIGRIIGPDEQSFEPVCGLIALAESAANIITCAADREACENMFLELLADELLHKRQVVVSLKRHVN